MLALGDSHTCALTGAGAVMCWGDNTYFQLGDGSTQFERLTPVPVLGLTPNVIFIASGGRRTCAVTSDGTVWCWGGSATDLAARTPAPTAGLKNVRSIAIGSQHSCAVIASGATQCWGANPAGQIGNGGGGVFAPFVSQAITVTGLTSNSVMAAVGLNHSCALLNNGLAYCWGANNLGQMGSPVGSVLPVDVRAVDPLSAITAGKDFACGLTTTGMAMFCWGDDAFGQLGNGIEAGGFRARQIVSLTMPIAAISAGRDHACAVTSSGAGFCWGNNSAGQLGISQTIASVHTPTLILDDLPLPPAPIETETPTPPTATPGTPATPISPTPPTPSPSAAATATSIPVPANVWRSYLPLLVKGAVAPPVTPQPTATPRPPDVCAVGRCYDNPIPFGQIQNISGVDYRVTAIERPSGRISGWTPKPGTHHVAIEIQARCVTVSVFGNCSVSGLYFNGISSSRIIRHLAPGTLSMPGFIGQTELIAGGQVQGWVAFEIPTEDTNVQLMYDWIGGQYFFATSP